MASGRTEDGVVTEGKKVRRALALAIAAMMAFALTACGDDSDSAQAGASETEDGSNGDSADGAGETDESGSYTVPDEYRKLTIVAASQGGSFYAWSVAATQLFNKYLDGAEFSVQAGSPAENTLLIESGEADAAIVSVRDLVNATGDPEAVEDTKIRTLWNPFNLSWQLLAGPGSEASVFTELEGSRIAAGIVGGEYDLFLDAIECAGLSEDDFEAQAIGKSEAADAYKDGSVDAWAAASPVPFSGFTDALTTRGGHLIALDDDIIECMASGGQYAGGEIPAGSYDGQDEAVPTIQQWYQLGVSEDLPEDLVFNMTRVLDEHFDELVAAFPGGREGTAEATAEHPGFELHPGAARQLGGSAD